MGYCLGAVGKNKVVFNKFHRRSRRKGGEIPFRIAENIFPVGLYIKTDREDVFGNSERYFTSLASASSVEFIKDDFVLPDSTQAITHAATIYIPLGDMVDTRAEKERLKKELDKCEKEIEFISRKLNNDEFVSKAPARVVENEREKLSKQLALKESLLEALKVLS